MGDSPGILMRGNGAVTAATSLEAAVVFAWFLEDAARVELAALQAGRAEEGAMTPEEARDRAVSTGRTFERMWDYLVVGDPEAGPMEAGFKLPREEGS
jgi:HCOMODA/2-hydroxy-3-carboxy-muconic semialdehyde decarboxylase